MLTTEKLMHFITGNRGKNKTRTGWTMRFQAYFFKSVCIK